MYEVNTISVVPSIKRLANAIPKKEDSKTTVKPIHFKFFIISPNNTLKYRAIKIYKYNETQEKNAEMQEKDRLKDIVYKAV